MDLVGGDEVAARAEPAQKGTMEYFIGFIIAIFIAVTGVGAGTITTPLLILFAGIKPVIAIGTDLAYGAVTKTVGGWRHLRKDTVDLRIALWLGVGSIPGAIGGTWLLSILHHAYGKDFDTIVLVLWPAPWSSPGSPCCGGRCSCPARRPPPAAVTAGGPVEVSPGTLLYTF